MAFAATNPARQVAVSFAVSGATTLNPSGSLGAAALSLAATPFSGYVTTTTANIYYELSKTLIITGLTAGTNTFTMQYLTDNNTDTFGNRSIWVEGIA
jgi:hypothetical protein